MGGSEGAVRGPTVGNAMSGGRGAEGRTAPGSGGVPLTALGSIGVEGACARWGAGTWALVVPRAGAVGECKVAPVARVERPAGVTERNGRPSNGAFEGTVGPWVGFGGTLGGDGGPHGRGGLGLGLGRQVWG